MNNAGKGSVAPKIEPRSVPGRTREAPWCPRAFRERLGSTLGAPRGAPGVPRERPEGPQTTSAGGWLRFIDFIRFLLILTVKTDMIVILSRPLSRSGAVLPQNARVDATFSRCIAFSQSRWPWGGSPAETNAIINDHSRRHRILANLSAVTNSGSDPTFPRTSQG